MNHQGLSSFIWSVADLLRGDYKQSEYGKVILPFTVLRRLDCVLEATRPAVLAEYALRQREGMKGRQHGVWMKENEITGTVVDAAIRVHISLGPGLLESVYEVALAHELGKRGLNVTRQAAIPVSYDGIVFEMGFRADLIVEGAVIVELKSVEKLARVHQKQLLTYLRLADRRVGLLINFGAEYLKDGIVRVVNGLDA